jgi:hypothetical protein
LLLSAVSQEFRNSLSSFESEVELSPDYLVVTYKLRSSSPDSPQETTARALLQGQYKYSKGKCCQPGSTTSLRIASASKTG